MPIFLTTPLGHRLRVTTGDYLVRGSIRTRTCGGVLTVRASFSLTKGGTFRTYGRTAYVRAPSGGLVFTETGNPVVVEVFQAVRSTGGRFSVRGVFSDNSGGSYRVAGIVNRSCGGVIARIGLDNVSVQKWGGVFRIYRNIAPSRGGVVRIYGPFDTGNRGEFKVYKNFLPITKRGLFNTYSSASIEKNTRYRIANDAVAGFVVYVGVGGPPDFTQPPAAFAASLPVTFAPPLPDPGQTHVLFVVTRRRNKYGLESLNQTAKTIVIDENGNKVRAAIAPPVDCAIVPTGGDYFTVFASYPGYGIDADPATGWRVFLRSGQYPEPLYDEPVLEVLNAGPHLQGKIGPYPSGGQNYTIAVVLIRAADSYQTEPAYAFVNVDPDPQTPIRVLGG